MHKLLLCDPAFRNFGWAVMELGLEEERVVDVGVVRTEKSDKKQKLLASDDNHRCVGEIVLGLLHPLLLHQPFMICAESQQGSKNAHAMQLQGMAWGALSAIVHSRKVPLLQASPQAVKKALCGRKDASKEDIEAAVCKRYAEVSRLVQAIKPPSAREHIYDAIAVGVTCLSSETIQMARRMAYMSTEPQRQPVEVKVPTCDICKQPLLRCACKDNVLRK
jgi:Holliday junction resolvasome RuvABC endonuclease subunit